MKKTRKTRVWFEFDYSELSGYLRIEKTPFKLTNFDKVLNVYVNHLLLKGTDQNGYTSINHKYFKSSFTGYKIYLDYLIQNGLMGRDYYKAGERSFGYRMTEEMKERIKIKSITYIPVKSKKSLIQKNSEQDFVDSVINERLIKDFSRSQIDFNLFRSQLEKTKDEWGNFIDIGKWFRNNYLLYRWKKGYKSYKLKTYRIYSNFTFLSSHVRTSNIKLNNEPVVEFDISNSFPLMLAYYANKNNVSLKSDQDFITYSTDVISGQFYKKLTYGLNKIRNCNKQGNEDEYSTRLLSKAEVKHHFQVYLNGNNKRGSYKNGVRPLLNEYMNSYHPCIHQLILKIKEQGDKVYNELVVIETALIQSIIKELYDKYEDIKILTCHDAIYVQLSFEDRVREVWNNKRNDFIKELPFEQDEDDNTHTDWNDGLGINPFDSDIELHDEECDDWLMDDNEEDRDWWDKFEKNDDNDDDDDW